MKKLFNLLLLISLAAFSQSCVLSKVIAVPMRVGGAVISIVPVIGNQAHDAIDTMADSVDEMPL
ncbi:MAG TPA: hypothetical protein EYO51_03795 [Methylococcaceae bacterium]|jgi:hypothetical protein|nr:hypothetical protein [Methylococcaceae bacterium]HIA45658.1 hypothetical protein [Methylococcaceae bacterium]HIB62260.1 hypothetical protein [Methylococcaceae bacterium]HIN68495.1 hypothetical protein [Methylococcales bacterium]HIO44238.1 hypothetical protein [Methylococcales bacterium]